MDIPYRLITISSTTCSGSSTLTNLLSDAISWPQYNIVSQHVREYLAEHNLVLSDVQAVPDHIHLTFDAQVKERLKTDHHKIFIGRTTGWLACEYSDIFKVFIFADDTIRAKRYAKRERVPLEQAKRDLNQADSSNWQRYERLYKINPRDQRWYNLQIDTTSETPDQSLDRILAALT